VASRIRILADDVANRIAAGEVVEAPHSVVKELVENALDAGATEITIAIKGGGSDLVRVSDNGTGMNPDDALAAFDRFATSKLAKEADLVSISTLGFRGEALPSIASVSRMRLLTCEKGSVEGTEVTLVGGEVRGVRPAGRSPGTTVEVSALFFNTPARRKFLKSDRVELRRIMDLLTEYAALRPEIRFDVEVDGRPVLGLLPTDSVKERVAALVGSGMVKEMLPVAHEDGPYGVSGLLGKPSLARPRGVQQVIAVNGRPVRSRLLSAAIRAGYGELLPRDRHPIVFLFLRVDAGLVDVNVHPTKREVRFGEDRRIFGLVESAVREALMAFETAPVLTGGPDRHAGASVAASGEAGTPVRLEGGVAGVRWDGEPPSAEQLSLPAAVRETEKPFGEIASKAGIAEGGDVAPATKFWQLHRAYIFVQTREGVLIIDQHAAHERVLYEKARRTLLGTAEAGPSQQLLFPVVVELSPGEVQIFDEVHALLDKLGLSVRPLSGRTVLIEAVPGAFPRWPHDRILRDILTDVPSGSSATRDIVESIAKTVACRAAIKSGDRLEEDEMRSLIDQLFATELPYSCPHGRPTFMRMTSSELDKRFGRS
jgi:DNA mismatch repair protein MutL